MGKHDKDCFHCQGVLSICYNEACGTPVNLEKAAYKTAITAGSHTANMYLTLLLRQKPEA